MKLTIKQKKFADEYIISGNAYQSAKKAGYSENYSKGNVIKLLENVRVKAYIDDRLKEIQSKKIAQQEEVLEYLTRVIREEETEKILKYTMTGEQELIEIPPTIANKTKAAELLGKRYSLWTENTNLTLTEPVIIKGADDLE